MSELTRTTPTTKVDPRSVQCPRCWADPRQNCAFPSGEVTACHGSRWNAAYKHHVQVLCQAVELMAAELASALPSKPFAGDADKWLRYAAAVLERDQRSVDALTTSLSSEVVSA